MPQSYRGKPRSVSRVVLEGGEIAVLVPRERKHFSQLRDGYPLAEEYLDHLANTDVDAVAIDDGECLYVFDLERYRRGDRVGHAPYPIKRVAPLSAATVLEGARRDRERRAAEWEWLTANDLEQPRGRNGRTATTSLPRKGDSRVD